LHSRGVGPKPDAPQSDSKNEPKEPKTEVLRGPLECLGRDKKTLSEGRYDTLLVETRGLKGPRVYEVSGIPFHADGQTIIKERIWCSQRPMAARRRASGAIFISLAIKN
jgi:hypothetical protein